ncbi:histidine kinase [Pontibacter sp. JH31]|uniref:Histidine kinase n=1 Tax=Pontibacter aquaedesilientis TaxID=2766980 RepID=A0ABR7XK19_9BACT|nr:histidine kinase [Pontibacter aquaedesilientis]MBD1398642.1 histidine kinase [Pontibacter aquaedesilientis]
MNKKKIILFHCLFWFFDFFKDTVYGFQYYYFYDAQYTLASLYKTTAVDFVRTLLTAALFYLNALVLVPRFFGKGRYGLYALSLLALLVAFTPVHYLLEVILLKYFNWATYGREITMVWIFQSVLRGSLMYILLGIAYGYVVDYFKTQEEKKELEKAKMATELAFLKSQINPHFLFNTINDIYSLTYQKSDLAPEALLKLSALLRYMLRESEADKVLLSKEVAYLEDVIDLQRIGLKGHAFIEFEKEGATDQKLISPLVLIAFVENAFKHGVCDDPNHPIHINLAVEGNTLLFKVLNWKNNDQKDRTGGIGLVNVRRRLELLYPDCYTLEITDEPHTFKVELALQLNAMKSSQPNEHQAIPAGAY